MNSKNRALEVGLRAHYFLRMTARDRFSKSEDLFECACGLEFEDTEQLREHQNLHLRIFLGIAEEIGAPDDAGLVKGFCTFIDPKRGRCYGIGNHMTNHLFRDGQ